MGDVSLTMSTLDPVRYAVDLQPFSIWKCLPQELSVQNGSITEENYFPVLNYPNMDLQHLPKWDGERELLFSAAHRKRVFSKDTTGALKMWLRRHKKNPYPSKAEKIMLAILSRMTLTQVSTWFANARRRLKKDFPDDDVAQSNDSSELLSDMCYYKSN